MLIVSCFIQLFRKGRTQNGKVLHSDSGHLVLFAHSAQEPESFALNKVDFGLSIAGLFIAGIINPTEENKNLQRYLDPVNHNKNPTNKRKKQGKEDPVSQGLHSIAVCSFRVLKFPLPHGKKGRDVCSFPIRTCNISVQKVLPPQTARNMSVHADVPPDCNSEFDSSVIPVVDQAAQEEYYEGTS